MLSVLAFALALAAPAASFALSELDTLRAETPKPSAALRGETILAMVRTLNAALESDAGLSTRPCDDVSLDELASTGRVLLSLRSPALDAIYAAVADRRALRNGTAAVFEDSWARAAAFARARPIYLPMVRAGACAELVALYEHHLPAAGREEFKQAGLALPRLATEKYALAFGDEADAAAAAAYDE